MARDASGLRDAADHAVDVAAVDRLLTLRAERERAGGPFAAAGLQRPEHRDGDRHRGGFAALPDQMQHPVTSEGLGVVLDPDRRGLGCPQGVNAEQVRQGAMVDGHCLGDLEQPDELEPVQSLGAGLVGMDTR